MKVLGWNEAIAACVQGDFILDVIENGIDEVSPPVGRL